MRIAYIISDDITTTSGVVKKVESKVKYWKLNGHNVKIVSLKSNGLIPIIEDGIVVSEYVKDQNFKKKLLRRFTLSKKLDNCLSKINPDIIYIRYMVNIPDLIHVLKKYAPYIVEINSNDVEETKLGNKSRYILNLLSRNHFLGNASALVSVSKELMAEDIFTKFNKKFIIIGNGYDFNTVINKKNNFNHPPKFLFVGSPNQPWHGVDKILQLASKLTMYEFHIVGPTKTQLVGIGKIGNNVIVHGYCDSKYLEDLFPKCDIGIATLALHRNNMNEASPLKSREYLAYGLPIIIGYEDTDLPKDFEFVLNIGNYENNIIDHIYKIETFANSFQNIHPNQVIESSKKYLNYDEKERKRLEFIENILKKDS